LHKRQTRKNAAHELQRDLYVSKETPIYVKLARNRCQNWRDFNVTKRDLGFIYVTHNRGLCE